MTSSAAERVRLRKVMQGGARVFTLKYQGDGVRAEKTVSQNGSTVNHDYTWSPFGLLHDSHDTTFYTPGFGHRANGSDRYYQTDWLGSTRYLTDSSGNAVAGLFYDAFGNRAASDPVGAHPTDLMFAGGWGYQTEWSSATEPGLGLHYLTNRYYDPALSRFISPDPIGVAGGLNLYGYVDNDPVGAVDPLGLEANTVTPTLRLAIAKIIADAAQNPQGARAQLMQLMDDFGSGFGPAQTLIQNSLARVDRIESGINFISRIGQNPYAVRLAQRLSDPLATTCNKLVDAVHRGQPVMNVGIGSHNLGNGFYELRGADAARVIIRQVGPKTFEIIGKFQGHARGDAFNRQTIQRLIEDRLKQGR